MTFTVAFVGLPSSGKSSIINSLLNKRILESGVCRTTTTQNELSDIITDDDGNKFCVIDLPGICDSEENDTKFTDMTQAYITKANLIFWVSDVNKAFITTHEVNEYNKLKKYLNTFTNDNGTLYDISIIISKCNFDSSDKKLKKKSRINEDGEIDDEHEDTNLCNMVDKVKEKFPNENIMLFNAYGRISHNKKASSVFKQFVNKMYGNLSDCNTRFSISNFYETYTKRQEKEYCDCFIRNYDNYLAGKITIDVIMKHFAKMNDKNRIKYTLQNTIIEDKKFNFYKYKLVDSIIKAYPNIYSLHNDNITSMLLTFTIYIINNNYLSVAQNKIDTFTLRQLYDNIVTFFEKLSFDAQINVFDDVIIKNINAISSNNCVIIYHLIYDIYSKNTNILKNEKYYNCIKFEFNILKQSIFMTINNILFDSAKIYDMINKKFINLSVNTKEKIIDDIIFENSFELTDANRIEILKQNLTKETWIAQYNFKTKFNDFILKTGDSAKFQKMSNMMIQYCNINANLYNFETDFGNTKNIISQYKFCQYCRDRNILTQQKLINGQYFFESNYVMCPTHNIILSTFSEQTRKTKEEMAYTIENFLTTYNKMINDDSLLIVNKLQILHSIYNSAYTKTCDFNTKYTNYINSNNCRERDNNHNYNNQLIMRRIILTDEFKTLSTTMFNRIYSNKMTDCSDMMYFFPLDKTELLFDIVDEKKKVKKSSKKMASDSESDFSELSSEDEKPKKTIKKKKN